MKKILLGILLTTALAAVYAGGASSGGSARTRSGDFLSSVSWDAEYDVVVVGFGGAGATAAFTAADAGAKVLLLEKAPEGEEGGNTRYAAQLVLSPSEREPAIEYYKAMRGKYNNQTDEMIEYLVDGLMANREWLVKIGADRAKLRDYPYVEYPALPGSKSMVTLVVNSETWNGSYWKLLRKNVTDRADKIDVWYESPAVQLLQDRETKIIHGVKVENKGKTYNVRAKNGVVLASGGFENNDEMLESYAQLADCYSKGARFNTGDGIKMALDVGADLWHMSALSGPDVNFINPETGIANGYYFTYPKAAAHATGFTAHNVINVGGDGTRFMSETFEPKHGHIKSGGTWFSLLVPQTAWCVFDETARNITPAYPSWSKGMVDEINKGWVIKANSIQELAQKTGISADGLEKTIAQYNQYCAQGNDPDFHVEAEYLKPVRTAPFYAFPIKASLTNTQGGPKRNIKCEVLDVWGNPIPHLYSAGELGSFFTDIYNGGGNLGECGFTGRDAGKNAAVVKRDVPSASVMGNKAPVDFRIQAAAITAGAGEYLGTGSGMGGDLVVRVKLDGKRIVSVEVVRHNETPGISDRALSDTPRSIVEKQSVQVDAVTGATATSKAIMQAAADALSKAQ